MAYVSHAIPWMYHHPYNTLTENEIEDLTDDIDVNIITKSRIITNEYDSLNNTDISKEILEISSLNSDLEDVFETKDNDKHIEDNANGHKAKESKRCGFENVSDETKRVEYIILNKKTKEFSKKVEPKKKLKKNETVLNKETRSKREGGLNRYSHNTVWKRKRGKNRKERWGLNSGILATLVILNVIGRGVSEEVVSTSSLASLLGYPSTCALGSEVVPCSLALTCWFRGGTRLRGCGGWLFACCQPPEDSWNSFDNNIPSSDWQYKMTPPRLRQVPQRSVMPNNVFRRRVDDEVTQVDCGIPSNRILQKRIIGGREARFAEFPWQAHVRISEFQCGGVLVSQWYVATAAHCVSRAHIRDIVVWLGALDTSAGSRTARKVGVHQKILHPLFQFRMTQPDRYDIALLKLSRPISFTRHIRAICLPDGSMPLRGRSAVIAGWGKTDATDTHTGTNMLRSASVPILSKEQCITWHQSKQISVEIHSEMICAGHSDGHQDACLGDSGGPLIVPENGRYYLVGITSAGFGCGVDHQPGIYHNVQVTANWIRRVLSQEDSFNTANYDRNTFM